MRDQPTPEQTQERFAEIRQRVDALGIEPWFYVHSPQALHSHTVAEGRERRWTAVCAMTYKNDAARRDAEFIAHARQDVPFLLSQVDALTATLAHLTQERENDWIIWQQRIDDAQAERDAYRRNASLAERKRAEQAEATLARVKAQRDELRNALVKVRAHTSYVNPTDELLRGLLQSIERIADAALVDPPVSSSTETKT